MFAVQLHIMSGLSGHICCAAAHHVSSWDTSLKPVRWLPPVLQPNYYKGKNGTTNGDDYIKCCFVFDWRDFSRALSCPKGPSSCVNNQFAGPVWGHIFMFPRAMDWFIRCVDSARDKGLGLTLCYVGTRRQLCRQLQSIGQHHQ